jgi:hypothetical protein
MMRPYWITVRPPFPPAVPRIGVGVTATSPEGARAVFAAAFGMTGCIAGIRPVADVCDLDRNHFLPNMGNIFPRGVRFPRLSG